MGGQKANDYILISLPRIPLDNDHGYLLIENTTLLNINLIQIIISCEELPVMVYKAAFQNVVGKSECSWSPVVGSSSAVVVT